MAVRRSKYGVRLDPAGKAARTVDGVLFDSMAEAKHYVLLKQLERTGEIHELTRQPKFPLSVDGVHLGNYRGDFSFRRNGEYIVRDVKGHMTPLSKWKIKHVWAQYQIRVEIVK
jgi:hypothetical protein